jgi:hypothetical protein
MNTSVSTLLKYIKDHPNDSYIGLLEFQDDEGEWHDFEVYSGGEALVFGSHCNAGLLISGFMMKEEYETTDEALQELLEELKAYYNEGAEYCSRIECNDRM